MFAHFNLRYSQLRVIELHPMSETVRSTGPKAARVLEALAEQRRHTIVVAEDDPWLRDITRDPVSLLDRMEAARLLYRVGRGRYVVAPRGTFSAAQAAPPELLVDLAVRGRGPYFIGFLSALIAHRLTDLHSNLIYAAIRQDGGFGESERALSDGVMVKFVRLASTRWPADRDRDLERVRVLPGSKEFVWRSSLERTLVDVLNRPDLAGGIETVIGSWSRARERDVDWDIVCAIATDQGPSTIRRTAFVLRLLGLRAVVDRNFPRLTGRSARTPLDRGDSFALSPEQVTRDRVTGVVVNVPEQHLLGWAEATALP